ncbi:MAG: glycosyl hydrolase [Isosphaeraceae bacterium]|jgi:hypothetical protein|nr:MAG: glycosyl hydrolase [Isosphaeraceae bacterium]
MNGLLLSLSLVLGPPLGPLPDQEPTALFDGSSLNGWTLVGGTPGNWLAQDGRLITRGQGGGWLSTEREYDNFELSLEYKLQPGGNSGVFIRAPRSGDPAYTGIEIQILDDDDPRYQNLKPYQYCGSVYGVIPAQRGATRGPGQWNQMIIRADNRRIQVVLNGQKIVDGNLDEHRDAAAEHPGILRERGYIGLQSHDEPVEFRNLTIRPLD